MTIEARIEDELIATAKRAGFLVRKARWDGRNGCPDRCLMGHGLTVWVELKRPDGRGELSPEQQREIRLMRQAKQRVYVIETYDQLRRMWNDLSGLTRGA